MAKTHHHQHQLEQQQLIQAETTSMQANELHISCMFVAAAAAASSMLGLTTP